MQIPRCYTDHSLLGFDTIGGIFINKISKFALADVCHVICVSNTSRENTVLRTLLNPINVSTIPNATIFENFTPCLEGRPNNGMIYIVVVSRLVERKGISILKNVIPRIAKYYPNIKFLIVGDGPKRVDLEQVCEKYQLQDRVFLYGALDNNKIRSILIKGHIFLNTSLTEAFCISIVEAASCGLLVVSTDVGGISEVLPSDLVVLAEPSVKSIYEAVTIAIKKVVTRDFIPTNVAERLKVYSWNSVSTRTEKVYIKCMEMQKSTFADRVHRYFGCGGAISGTIAVAIITMCTAFLSILEWFQPAETIEKPLCWSKYAVISKPDTYDIQNDICA